MSATRLRATYRRSVAASSENLPSPCIGVCQMDATSGQCAGCYRTLAEIAAWSKLPDAGKRLVWHAIVTQRLPAPAP